MTVDPGKEGVDREVKEGVLRAADALSHKGYVVEHVDPPAVVEAWNVWSRLTAADIRELLLDDIRQKAGKDANRFLEMALAQRPDAEDRYIRDFARHGALARLWSEFQQKFPVIVGPVSTKNPFPVGKDLASGDDVDEISHSLRLVVTANLLGLPAAVVPVGVANGVPQAVQIIGPIFRDDLCLDVAENLEDSLGTITPIDPIW